MRDAAPPPPPPPSKEACPFADLLHGQGAPTVAEQSDEHPHPLNCIPSSGLTSCASHIKAAHTPKSGPHQREVCLIVPPQKRGLPPSAIASLCNFDWPRRCPQRPLVPESRLPRQEEARQEEACLLAHVFLPTFPPSAPEKWPVPSWYDEFIRSRKLPDPFQNTVRSNAAPSKSSPCRKPRPLELLLTLYLAEPNPHNTPRIKRPDLSIAHSALDARGAPRTPARPR
jgi:hypothetical protein